MLTTCPKCLHEFAARGVCCGRLLCGGGLVLVQPPPAKAEPSPSAPLRFVLPPPQLSWVLPPSPPQPHTDLTRVSATVDALRRSGWYYEGMSWQDSAALLQDTAPGTFLVRNSQDPRFLFALSVQTDRGPTSVRIHYVMGLFRLDAEAKLAPLMPMFDCVLKLVEYYIEATARKEPRSKDQVWIDAQGHMYSHILLTKPLYRKDHMPSLQHLARLALNRQKKKIGTMPSTEPLPQLINKYLEEYPYCH